MQAAGRLRQLARGTQSVRFVGPPDVTAKIAHANSGLPAGAALEAAHVLRWVMANTVQATLHGVLQWAGQVGVQCWFSFAWCVCPALSQGCAALATPNYLNRLHADPITQPCPARS